MSEPTKPSWSDLADWLTPTQIACLRMLESASELTEEADLNLKSLPVAFGPRLRWLIGPTRFRWPPQQPA